MSVGQQLLVFEELCKKEDHVQSFDNAVLAAVHTSSIRSIAKISRSATQ
jgi:hypothetical protein